MRLSGCDPTGVRTRYGLGGLLALAALAGSPGAGALDLVLERVAEGFSRPVFVTAAPGDDERLFVVERGGDIRTLNRRTGMVAEQPFLSVQVGTAGEQGLLGLAFDPGHADNGAFYVNLTNTAGDTEIRRYQVGAEPGRADPGSERLVLSYEQPFDNHNGGWIGFGPNDGMLYIASGDGGGAHDPGNRAQDVTDQKLGKLLRVDASQDAFPADDLRNYAVPTDNPFVGRPGDDEIWAYGLRNPWRASFDRETGDLYIGDVGQQTQEEVDFQPADAAGGANYGWRLREGLLATPTGGVGGPRPEGNVDPVHVYAHDEERGSITGGYVYRGPIEELAGAYFFGDFLSGEVWSFRLGASGVEDLTNWTDRFLLGGHTLDNVVSFGEDNDGNLYVVDFDGEIFRVAPVPLPGAFALLLAALPVLAALRGRRRPKG